MHKCDGIEAGRGSQVVALKRPKKLFRFHGEG